MPPTRPFSVLATQDQWVRASHDGTTYDATSSSVTLAWSTDAAGRPSTSPLVAAGLVFDCACRLYRSLPAEGRVERRLWAATDPRKPPGLAPPPVPLFGGDAEPVAAADGVSAPAPLFTEPRGLAIDADDKLFVADAATSEVLVLDLWTRTLVRRIALPKPAGGGAGPLDLLAVPGGVLAAMAPLGLVYKLTVKGDPAPLARAWLTAPSRLAVSPAGEVVVLDKAGAGDATIAVLDRKEDAFVLPYAADIAFDKAGALVVSFGPGDAFLRFSLGRGTRAELPYLSAPGYDGLGIVAAPNGTIAYFSDKGLRVAIPARLRYEKVGRVACYRLDSGVYQTTWGRLFLDACIPTGAEVRFSCVATDEPPDEASIAWQPPASFESLTVVRPDLTPPLPPLSLALTGDATQTLHRRASGRELPWARIPEEQPFETYEAPIAAPAGRYLWVTLELRGNTRVTPKITALRAERPAHDLLRKLPRAFSEEEATAAFLLRFLSMPEGVLNDLEGRSVERRALVEPFGAPEEALPWLASFLGLALDERWSPEVRRTLIQEATWLFRFRGTVPGLRRFLEICLGVAPVIVEHYRLRGVPALLGDSPEAASAPVLGAGFRVGGAIGDPDEPPITSVPPDAFKTHAHRFSVLVPLALTPDELDMVNDVLALHRPAHTIVDVCSVTSGMRVGVGLHAGMTSLVGRTGGFDPLLVGASSIGTDGIVGKPLSGAPAGGLPLGPGFRVG